MGNILRVVPETDLRQNLRQITTRDLDDRLLESTPAIDRAVSRIAPLVDAKQNLLQSAPLFKKLSTGECRDVVSVAAERRYAVREVIVHEGDEGGEILVVMSGRVKVSQISHTGDEVILRIGRAGDVIGGLGMSPGETHSSTVRALEPCKVLCWKADDFDRLCRRSANLQRNVVQIMNNMLQILQECFCELATLRVSSRLARTLLRLAEQDGREGQNTHIAFTCEELGQMAGTTLFTVSRLLSKWTEMGVLYPENRGIVIEDFAGLLAIADESPAPANRVSLA